MKNKGFTLVELLAVIVILAIIAVITIPNLIGVVNTSRTKLNKEQKLAIENAAREWGVKNLYIDDNNVSVNKLSAKKLQDDGFLEKKDSLKGININDLNKAGVCIKYKSNQYVYTYTDNIDTCS